jgi:hypothetical protein
VERRNFHRRISACLAVITVVVWLSLTGLGPSAYAHRAARTHPIDQSTRQLRQTTKIEGTQ